MPYFLSYSLSVFPAMHRSMILREPMHFLCGGLVQAKVDGI